MNSYLSILIWIQTFYIFWYRYHEYKQIISRTHILVEEEGYKISTKHNLLAKVK